ncbi:glycosyltransferase [Streptomyces sp. NPDC059989]|uniref:glycosyltransferase n=1 Tax=Streptomyces sp. NPDC059989 TaxID=3347026 RepID=UPI0036863E65
MDIPSAIAFIAAALLLPRLLPHPRFVFARAQYDLPIPTQQRPEPGRRLRFSLLVPMAYNPDIEGTLGGLLRTSRQDFEILLLVQTDDVPSLMSAWQLAERYPDQVRVVDDAWGSGDSVADALNHALSFCQGELTGVIETGDPIRGSLLGRVDGAFRISEADVVRVAAELPDGRLTAPHLYAAMDDVVCVRGTRPVRVTRSFHLPPSDAYFVRTDLLRSHGGWDGNCEIEELELMAGLRRSRRPKVKGAMLYGEPVRHHGLAPWHGAPSAHPRHRPGWEVARLDWHRRLLAVHWTREWRYPLRVRDVLFSHRTFLFPSLRGVVAVSALWIALSVPFALPALPAYRFALPFWVVLASVLANARGALWLRSQTGRGLMTAGPTPRGVWRDRAQLAGAAAAGWLWNLRALVSISAMAKGVYPKYPQRNRASFDPDLYERSRRAEGDAPPDPPLPSDLLDIAGSPDTPAAAEAMSTGLDALFRALGPPPESVRIAQTGPPQGDGGTSDG